MAGEGLAGKINGCAKLQLTKAVREQLSMT